MKWILIASAIVIGLLVIFILYDQRKNIFKKRSKKEKKKEQKPAKEQVPVKEEHKEAVKEEKPEISLEQRIPEVKKQTKNPVVEEVVIKEDDRVEYDTTEPKTSGFRRTINPNRYAPPASFKPQKQSIKDQINDLSPEMKAILFGNMLDKKDD